ncbi:MAG: orotidine-5'-phosphate decarboxylase [Myxococcota bacterium]|nr:orotidine-5'-phosphate decarboxylase [Myxococcota bacterium]
MTLPFGERLAQACVDVGAPVAVGLDPHLTRLPPDLRARFEGKTGRAGREAAAESVVAFCAAAVQGLAGRVAAVKPQVAFFEALGSPGFAALEEACRLARAAGLLVIVDAKRGDIASTAAAYARAALHPDGPLAGDALTVAPYMGTDTITPYLDICAEHGRGLFVLVRTTNPGSAALQHHGSPRLAAVVADALARYGADAALVGESGMSSIGAVVGASASAEAVALRARMPAAWFLVPGVGAQGGTAGEALAGAREDGLGALPVASRSVLFPPSGATELVGEVAAGVAQRAQALVDAVAAAR